MADTWLEETVLLKAQWGMRGMERGLVFEKNIEEGREFLEIVIAGDLGCGKTEFISRSSRGAKWRKPKLYHEELRIHLNETFFITIFNVKDTDYFEGNFKENTVFILCYDVDEPETFQNVERIWLPKVLATDLRRKFHFTLGIDRGEDHRSPTFGIARLQQKVDLHEKAQELMRRTAGGLAIQCSLDSVDEIFNVFQNALNSVFVLSSQN